MTYNPNRVLQPMKCTNTKKGREHDHDPQFMLISWYEALDAIGARSLFATLNASRTPPTQV